MWVETGNRCALLGSSCPSRPLFRTPGTYGSTHDSCRSLQNKNKNVSPTLFKVKLFLPDQRPSVSLPRGHPSSVTLGVDRRRGGNEKAGVEKGRVDWNRGAKDGLRD